MKKLPFNVMRYLRDKLFVDLRLTYLHIDSAGYLVEYDGYPEHYGLTGLMLNKPVLEQIPFLEGVLPISHAEVFEFVTFKEGKTARVHLFSQAENTWILLFDVSPEHDRLQVLQQKAQELSIQNARQSAKLKQLKLE